MAMLKPKASVVWLLTVALVALVPGIAMAVAPTFQGVQPANPTMDYTPQNFGIYDTYYEYFNEGDCRSCHGASTAERHHATEKATTGQCLDCHCDYPNVTPPVRNCLDCHNDGTKWCGTGEPQGNPPDDALGSPHHRTDASDSLQCTACHSPSLIVETNTVDVPSYGVSLITPTPHACGNCHWPTNCQEILPDRLDPTGATDDVGRVVTSATADGDFDNLADSCADDDSLFMTDWNGWPYLNTNASPANGYPKPQIQDGVGARPAPIMANGKTYYGTLQVGKAFMSVTGTHHEVGAGSIYDGNVYDECSTCHAADPDSPVATDVASADYGQFIRYCENCHSVLTLHYGIAEHTTDGPSTNRDINNNPNPVDEIYTIGGVLGQEVAANAKCVACHGDDMEDPPEETPLTPTITLVEPNTASPGAIVVLEAATAAGFGNQQTDDRIVMAVENPPLSGIFTWEEVPIYSWADNQVEFLLPGGSFWPTLPVNSGVKIGKSGAGFSNTQVLTVRKHPEIWSLAPNTGNWNAFVTVNGIGFGTQQAGLMGGGYGYTTYVEMHNSNDHYRMSWYGQLGPAIQAWGSSSFQTVINYLPAFPRVVDLKTGLPVPEPQLYEGTWQIQVITDYFQDDGDNQYFSVNNVGADMGKLDLSLESLIKYGQVDDPDTTDVREGLSGVYPENQNILDGDFGTLNGGDILLHRERSETFGFTVNHTPILNAFMPRKGVYGKNIVSAIGYGFGTEEGTVTLGNREWALTLGQGLPADPNEKHVVLGTDKVGAWATTKFKFKMPNPQYKGFIYGHVTVPGFGTSNIVRIKYLGKQF